MEKPVEQEFNVIKLNQQLDLLRVKDEEEITAMMSASPEDYIDLLESIQVFLSTACGNANKLGEVITTLKLQSLLPECCVTHVKHAYGADIQLVDRVSGKVTNVENKDSFTKKQGGYKSNWNFTVSRKAVKHHDQYPGVIPNWDEMECYVRDCCEKMTGYVVLRASCRNGELNTYVLNGNFVALVLCKKALTAYDMKEAHINLGGTRCHKCHEYHRIVNLQRFEARFKQVKKRRGDDLIFTFECFSEKEWESILTPSSDSCTVRESPYADDERSGLETHRKLAAVGQKLYATLMNQTRDGLVVSAEENAVVGLPSQPLVVESIASNEEKVTAPRSFVPDLDAWLSIAERAQMRPVYLRNITQQDYDNVLGEEPVPLATREEELRQHFSSMYDPVTIQEEYEKFMIPMRELYSRISVVHSATLPKETL